MLRLVFGLLEKKYKIEALQTNDMSGIGIFETNEQPVWVKWNFGGDGNSMENYFFQGHDTFDVVSSSNHSPKFSVYFRRPDKSVTWWLDRGGSGSFTERIFYNTNGDFFKRELRYDNAWRTVDARNKTNGVLINGQWVRLQFGTNGLIDKRQTNQ